MHIISIFQIICVKNTQEAQDFLLFLQNYVFFGLFGEIREIGIVLYWLYVYGHLLMILA